MEFISVSCLTRFFKGSLREINSNEIIVDTLRVLSFKISLDITTYTVMWSLVISKLEFI